MVCLFRRPKKSVAYGRQGERLAKRWPQSKNTNQMNATIPSPVAPASNGVATPSLPKSRKGIAALPASDPRQPFIAGIYESVAGYSTACASMGEAAKAMSVSRSTLKEAVARAAQSGLFTADELIGIARAAAKSAKMTDQAVSSALIAAGLRQRAPRSDKGKTRGETPATPAVPSVPPPTAPADPKALALDLVKTLGKASAMEFLSVAYHTAASIK